MGPVCVEGGSVLSRESCIGCALAKQKALALTVPSTARAASNSASLAAHTVTTAGAAAAASGDAARGGMGARRLDDAARAARVRPGRRGSSMQRWISLHEGKRVGACVFGYRVTKK